MSASVVLALPLERMFSVPKPTVLAYAGSPCEIQVPSRPRDWYGNKTSVDDSDVLLPPHQSRLSRAQTALD